MTTTTKPMDDGGPVSPIHDKDQLFKIGAGAAYEARQRGEPPEKANGDAVKRAQYGLSIRDYFAAKAMQGDIAANSQSRPEPGLCASWAYEMADAMLRARQENSNG